MKGVYKNMFTRKIKQMKPRSKSRRNLKSINQNVSTMQLLVVMGTTPKVAPNTKKNYKYKTLAKGLQSQKGCSCYMPM